MGNCGSSCCRGGVRSIQNPLSVNANIYKGRSKDGLYEPALADSEREAVADLLQYLENVCTLPTTIATLCSSELQRAETDFFSGEPLRSLSTLVYSENVDLQRSASLTFAEITERGTSTCINVCSNCSSCGSRC